MAFKVLMTVPEGVDPLSDAIYRAQAQARQRVDPSDVYENETVHIDGAMGAPPAVHLRFPIGGSEGSTFAFAVFKDNPTWHDRPEAEWFAAAKKALTKFAAIRGRQIKIGPRPEDNQPLNMAVEMDRAPVEVLE